MDALLLIIGGTFIALLIYCVIFIWNFNSPKIQYSPTDIVYIRSLKAVHEMDSAATTSIQMITTTTSGPYPELVI
ncbi:MAG: hypothetical protein Q7U74_00270, partial [Saprospiraceae bacterium]|nr:hypothetical protein [Saprospiraceae bacterium]